ncbi:hypothetical protein [Novosphingobium huizhouense]|uniref:hypothetical protein n=1 Tax=Novosphingobium huizhouense TaxID=2866625 RepID=UPI001CD88318|nr:hypothetical protein [Novosphingobium huizhouense]
MKNLKFLIAAGGMALALSGAAANAGTPPAVADLIGMRGAFIEQEMTGRGYTFVKASGPQYFWNGATRSCVGVSISNGRVSAINAVPPAACGQSGGSTHQAPHGSAAHGGGLGGLAGMNSIAAIDEMSRRGFADVDSFSSGNTQYGIFFNRASRVCAQLTMADGKVVDASDIHTHPKCR